MPGGDLMDEDEIQVLENLQMMDEKFTMINTKVKWLSGGELIS